MTKTTEVSPVILPPTPPGARAREERASSAPAPGTLERESVRRMVTRSMRIGMWVWPTFTITDAWMCFVAYPGAPFGLFLLYRVLIELALIWTYRASRRSEVSAETLHFAQNASFTAAALAIALMGVSLGGIRSPYMHGISIVALVRAAVIPEPWRRGWSGFAAIAAAFPLVMFAGATISPVMRAEWVTTEALVAFASNYIFVLSSAVIGLLTSHIVWQAQQQVYRARRVGRYRLMAPIGKGGMGEVWLAWDLSLQRNVALKLLRVGDDAGPEMVARFEREALATSRLQSPHVIQIFDYGASDDGLYYIAMEFLSGRDLGTIVAEDGPLSPARAVTLVMQACLALEVAHNAGVIHRDIKPQNLFVVPSGDEGDHIKLLDFGIVRFREPRDGTLTWTGMLVGTPTYLAPELWSGAPADERSDVYSVGVTLYFLLTGRLPSASTTHAPSGGPVPIFDRPTAAERELESLVRRCLNPDPSLRVPTARALYDALAAMRPQLG
jgi:eukaryotic-like serine/threonine-protein kinase